MHECTCHAQILKKTESRRCSNYLFILDLTQGFYGFDKDNWKTRRETFKFRDFVRLILDILW